MCSVGMHKNPRAVNPKTILLRNLLVFSFSLAADAPSYRLSQFTTRALSHLFSAPRSIYGGGRHASPVPTPLLKSIMAAISVRHASYSNADNADAESRSIIENPLW